MQWKGPYKIAATVNDIQVTVVFSYTVYEDGRVKASLGNVHGPGGHTWSTADLVELTAAAQKKAEEIEASHKAAAQ